jgi:hypothetical protein
MLFANGEPRVTVFGAHGREHYEREFERYLGQPETSDP